MRHAALRPTVLGATICALTAAACTEEAKGPVAAPSGHSHAAALAASPDVMRKLAELRQWSAPFHTLEGAAAAGYTVNIGCIDETITGVDPAVARGMGYHVTRGDVDLVNDGVVNIDQPEFLVYAPHENDARLPREQRLRAARLVGFDYFVPASSWPHAEPPEFFGEPFTWSETFQGWMRHFYLWGNNPEGLTEDFNAHVRLCSELLNP